MVQGSGFRVQGSGFRVPGPGFRVQGSGFKVQGAGFRVQGSGLTSGEEGRERLSGRIHARGSSASVLCVCMGRHRSVPP